MHQRHVDANLAQVQTATDRNVDEVLMGGQQEEALLWIRRPGFQLRDLRLRVHGGVPRTGQGACVYIADPVAAEFPFNPSAVSHINGSIRSIAS